MFPPRDYMCQFFPILDKYPFLLIFCWGIRNVRIYYRMLAARCEKMWFRLSVKCLDIKEKIKTRFRKKEEEPEEMLSADAADASETQESGDCGSGQSEPERSEKQPAITGTAKEKEPESSADSGNAKPVMTEGDGQVEEFKD